MIAALTPTWGFAIAAFGVFFFVICYWLCQNERAANHAPPGIAIPAKNRGSITALSGLVCYEQLGVGLVVSAAEHNMVYGTLQRTVDQLRAEILELCKLTIAEWHHEAIMEQPALWQGEQVRSYIYALQKHEQRIEFLIATKATVWHAEQGYYVELNHMEPSLIQPGRFSTPYAAIDEFRELMRPCARTFHALNVLRNQKA